MEARSDKPMKKPNDIGLDKIDGGEDPIEDQPLVWDTEDIEIENRKPDLSEIEEDEAEF
jgi:hypothetical protein